MEDFSEPVAGVKEGLEPLNGGDPPLNPPFRAAKAEAAPSADQIVEPEAGIKDDLKSLEKGDPPLNPPFRAPKAEPVPDFTELQEPAAGVKEDLQPANGAGKRQRHSESEEEDEYYRAHQARGPVIKKGSECPYLDTISRQVRLEIRL